jgi:hypothetical protein
MFAKREASCTGLALDPEWIGNICIIPGRVFIGFSVSIPPALVKSWEFVDVETLNNEKHLLPTSLSLKLIHGIVSGQLSSLSRRLNEIGPHTDARVPESKLGFATLKSVSRLPLSM